MARKRLMGPAPEVQVVKTGDLHCDSCDKMFPSTFALDRHVKRFHMDKYNFTCKICSKRFMSEDSFENHAKTHVEEGPKFPCVKCTKIMGSKRAFNKHMRVQHGKKINLQYSFCKKVFHERDLQQHGMGCSQNPNRKEFNCDVCGVCGLYHHKKLMKHKREDHRWTHRTGEDDGDDEESFLH